MSGAIGDWAGCRGAVKVCGSFVDVFVGDVWSETRSSEAEGGSPCVFMQAACFRKRKEPSCRRLKVEAGGKAVRPK